MIRANNQRSTTDGEKFHLLSRGTLLKWNQCAARKRGEGRREKRRRLCRRCDGGGAGNFSSGRAKRLYGTHAQPSSPSARAFDLNYFSPLSSHPFIILSTFPHLENVTPGGSMLSLQLLYSFLFFLLLLLFL